MATVLSPHLELLPLALTPRRYWVNFFSRDSDQLYSHDRAALEDAETRFKIFGTRVRREHEQQRGVFYGRLWGGTRAKKNPNRAQVRLLRIDARIVGHSQRPV